MENILAVEDPEKHDPERDSPRLRTRVRRPASVSRARSTGCSRSESNYDDFARALGAEPVVVDEARGTVPTSGTVIRADLHDHRGWMDPLVYRRLIQKVVFVGTESSGKTTLARTLAERLDTLWTHEFGRELWEAQNLTGTLADHLKMARRQYEREQAALRHSRRFLFCDTNAWTTLQWSLRSYGTADARLDELVERTVCEYRWSSATTISAGSRTARVRWPGAESGRFQEQQIADLDRRPDLVHRRERARRAESRLCRGAVRPC